MTTPDDQFSYKMTKAKLEAMRSQSASLIKTLDFLLSLSEEDFNALAKPNPVRVEAAIALFSVVRNNPGIFPADIIDLAEGEQDAEARAALMELQGSLAPTLKRVQDTLNAVNSDLYRLGLNIYNIAKRYKDRLSHDDRAAIEDFAKLVGKRG
jgi:hypothetical protein